MSVVEVRRPPLSSDWSASSPSVEASPLRRRFALLSRPPVKPTPPPPPLLDPPSDRRRAGGGAGSSISKSKAADGLAGTAGGFEGGSAGGLAGGAAGGSTGSGGELLTGHSEAGEDTARSGGWSGESALPCAETSPVAAGGSPQGGAATATRYTIATTRSARGLQPSVEQGAHFR